MQFRPHLGPALLGSNVLQLLLLLAKLFSIVEDVGSFGLLVAWLASDQSHALLLWPLAALLILPL